MYYAAKLGYVVYLQATTKGLCWCRKSSCRKSSLSGRGSFACPPPTTSLKDDHRTVTKHRTGNRHKRAPAFASEEEDQEGEGVEKDKFPLLPAPVRNFLDISFELSGVRISYCRPAPLLVAKHAFRQAGDRTAHAKIHGDNFCLVLAGIALGLRELACIHPLGVPNGVNKTERFWLRA